MKKIIIAIILVGMLLLSGCEMIAGKAGSTGINKCKDSSSIIHPTADQASMLATCQSRCPTYCPGPECKCDASLGKGKPSQCPSMYIPYPVGSDEHEQLKWCEGMGPETCKKADLSGECGYWSVTLTEAGQCHLYCQKPAPYYCNIKCSAKPTSIPAPAPYHYGVTRDATTSSRIMPQNIQPTQTISGRQGNIPGALPQQYVTVPQPPSGVPETYQVPGGVPETYVPGQPMITQPHEAIVPGQVNQPYITPGLPEGQYPQYPVGYPTEYPPVYPAGYPSMPAIYPGQ